MKTSVVAVCIAACMSVIAAYPIYKPQPMPLLKGFGGIPCPIHGMHRGFGGGQMSFGGGHGGFTGGQIGFGGGQGGFGGDDFNDNGGVVTSFGRPSFGGQWGDNDLNNDIFNNDRFGNNRFNDDRFNDDRFGNDNGFFGNDDSRIVFGRPGQRGAVLSTPTRSGAFQAFPSQGSVLTSGSLGGIQQGGILRGDLDNRFDNFGGNDDFRRIQDQINHRK